VGQGLVRGRAAMDRRGKFFQQAYFYDVFLNGHLESVCVFENILYP